MKTPIRILTGLFLCSALATGSAWAADAETADLPENILAKMARYKSKRFNDDSDKSFIERRRGDQVGTCGGLNVGNVTAGRGVRSMPRQVTVVISGDVINANNKCN
ncbi:MAG: hypothetical protein KDG55_14370 [Rhodocyclaceae bacterium]|nr:hypothetical protein [Rhodocyclaceae bacterium]